MDGVAPALGALQKERSGSPRGKYWPLEPTPISFAFRRLFGVGSSLGAFAQASGLHEFCLSSLSAWLFSSLSLPLISRWSYRGSAFLLSRLPLVRLQSLACWTS